MKKPTCASVLILPLDGEDKGRGDGSVRFPSTPIPAFPHQGERGFHDDAAICRHFHSLRASVSSWHTSWLESTSANGLNGAK